MTDVKIADTERIVENNAVANGVGVANEEQRDNLDDDSPRRHSRGHENESVSEEDSSPEVDEDEDD